MQPLSLILPGDTRWNGLYYHWTRLCVHLAPCLSVYYENEFKQVNVLRKTHKGQQRMKKKLNNEKMTEDQLCAGQQIAALLSLPAKVTTVLQSKTVPTISIAYTLIKFVYSWIEALINSKIKLCVVGGNGAKELVEFKDLDEAV